METLTRKQVLKNGLKTFAISTKNQNNTIYTISTDINKNYWLYKGVLYDSSIFNIKAAKKVKMQSISKDTVYYISTVKEDKLNLFNLDKK